MSKLIFGNINCALSPSFTITGVLLWISYVIKDLPAILIFSRFWENQIFFRKQKYLLEGIFSFVRSKLIIGIFRWLTPVHHKSLLLWLSYVVTNLTAISMFPDLEKTWIFEETKISVTKWLTWVWENLFFWEHFLKKSGRKQIKLVWP